MIHMKGTPAGNGRQTKNKNGISWQERVRRIRLKAVADYKASRPPTRINVLDNFRKMNEARERANPLTRLAAALEAFNANVERLLPGGGGEKGNAP